MAMRFPFELNADKYLRNLWNKQTYLYLAEFFRTAKFDPNMAAVADQSIDDYRYAGGTSSDISASDWRLPGAGGSGSTYSYASYFKVIDASTYDEDGQMTACLIGVTDGASSLKGSPALCGRVKINGTTVDVAEWSLEIGGTATFYVWIHSWLSAADGLHAEITYTETDTPPSIALKGGLACDTQLAGRVVVVAGGPPADVKIQSITQDYLRGGEYAARLYSTCDDIVVECPE